METTHLDPTPGLLKREMDNSKIGKILI